MKGNYFSLGLSYDYIILDYVGLNLSDDDGNSVEIDGSQHRLSAITLDFSLGSYFLRINDFFLGAELFWNEKIAGDFDYYSYGAKITSGYNF